MADELDRTEKPTPKRREEARRKGQIAISQEIFTVANLFAVSLVLLTLGGTAAREGIRLFHRAWAPLEPFGPGLVAERLREVFGIAAAVMLPVLGAAATAAIIAGLIQTRGNIAPTKLRPKGSKLNPVSNLSRLVKQEAPILLGKSLLKLVVVGGVIGFVIYDRLDEYSGLSRLPLYQILGFQFGMVLRAFLAGCVAMLFIAAADYGVEVWKTEKALRMTRSDVKDEQRQAEGDPMIRARRRSLMLERMRSRMMDQVPKADVVVTNPEHIAVALIYQRDSMRAPKVAAKGRGFLAERIRDIAQQAGIPIVHNPPLAQTLYRSAKVNQIIPENLYQTVAELLAYIYRLDRARARAW